MEAQQVIHTTLNQKYKIRIEKASSTKGQDGFQVEASGDDMDAVTMQVEALYEWAKELTSGANGHFKIKEGNDADKSNPAN